MGWWQIVTEQTIMKWAGQRMCEVQGRRAICMQQAAACRSAGPQSGFWHAGQQLRGHTEPAKRRGVGKTRLENLCAGPCALSVYLHADIEEGTRGGVLGGGAMAAVGLPRMT